MNLWRSYRLLIVAAALVLAAVGLFSLNAGKESEGGFLSRLVLEAAGPVQEAVTSLGSGLGNAWDAYFALVHAAKQNKELKEQVAQLRQDLVRLEELERSNRRLRALLGLQDGMSRPVVAAEVVAADPGSHFRTAILSKGSAHGLAAQMPVVHPQGVVGRVVWTSPHYAKVLLLTDPNSGVDVFVQRSRASGVVEGAGVDRLRLKYVQHNADVTPGDKLITSGAAGVYPRGLLVGTVLTVKKEGKGAFLQVEAEPAVDFGRLEEVLVILHRRNLEE